MTTRRLAEFISNIRFEELPEAVRERAHLFLLDTLGAAIAGAHADSPAIARSVFADDRKGSLPLSVLLNSILASVIDSDDGYMNETGHLCHIGAAVVPSALAVAESAGASGKALIEGIVAGYEACILAGMALTDPVSGTYTTAGTPAAYGAAAAAAKILGLSSSQIEHAIGISEFHAPVPRPGRISKCGAMTKEALPWGAMAGVSGALLAQQGFTGPFSVFDEPNAHARWRKRDGEYLLLNTYFKPYCCCRFTHTALDAVLELRSCFDLNDLDRVTIEVGCGPDRLCNPRPMTLEAAEFSFPFVIAAALMEGGVTPCQMSKSRLQDPSLLALADKVEIREDKSLSCLMPGKFAARVSITTTKGESLQSCKESARGDPSMPLSCKEIQAKFFSWTEGSSPSGSIEELFTAVMNVEELTDTGRLVGLLREYAQQWA